MIAGRYPVPESHVTLAMTGGVAVYQGFAREATERVARVSAGATRDPSDDFLYPTYSTTSNGKKMQLMAFLENKSPLLSVADALVPAALASPGSDYANRHTHILGDPIGILLYASGSRAPVQETATGTIDLPASATEFTVRFGNGVASTGTGSAIAGAYLSGSVAYASTGSAGGGGGPGSGTSDPNFGQVVYLNNFDTASTTDATGKTGTLEGNSVIAS